MLEWSPASVGPWDLKFLDEVLTQLDLPCQSNNVHTFVILKQSLEDDGHTVTQLRRSPRRTRQRRLHRFADSLGAFLAGDWPLRCPIADRGNLCQYETATSHRVQSDSGKTARQERAQLASNNEQYCRFSELNCGVQLCGRAPSSDAKQPECCARHRSRFSRSRRCTLPLGEVPRRSVPQHATPSKWGGRCRAQNRRVHSGNRDQAHRGVKRCSQLRVVQRHHSGESGSRTTPRPSATIALRVEHHVVGKQWCIEVREVQQERALAQSLVKSLRIPSQARCQGESFGHEVPGCGGRCGICWM